MQEDDLITQIQQLPDEIAAPDRWQQIKAAIEAEKEHVVKEPKGDKGYWPKLSVAAAASFVIMLTFAGYFYLGTTPSHSPVLDQKLQLTIASIQQANSMYYAELGQIMKNDKGYVDTSVLQSLKDMRKAQQQYELALQRNPDDVKLQKKLIRSYQKETDILQKLTA